ncbi:TPA: hypothetical protein DDZ86_05150 [Candidatus Dependentiae bacterium]|nr:hypothetical protein [Candidatus Dependentiae bacterium]
MKYIQKLSLVLTLLCTYAPSLSASTLHKLVKKNEIEKVKDFLKNNREKEIINAQNSYGKTPLYQACSKNYKDIVKLLLENGANPNIPNKDKETPLYWACAKGYLEIVKLLLEKGANPNIANKDKETPLYLTCSNNFIEITRLLLENGAKVNILNKNGWTSLYWACCNYKLDIVKLLLEKDADVNIANKNRETPLYPACYLGYLDIVELLLKKGAKVNIPGPNGWPPLYWACAQDYEDIVKLLLKKGADVNITGPNGWTPLYWACSKYYLDIVKLLLKKGADVNITGPNGWTPLYWACSMDYVDIVELLLKKGADVNITGPNGWTTLYLACYWRQLEIIKLLLENGANPTLKPNNNESPLSLICSQKWTIEQREKLLMSLVPTETNLSQNAKNFIKLVITTLAKQMQNNSTQAPKVPQNNGLRVFKVAVKNPEQEITCIEDFVRILLFTFTPDKMALYTWPKNFFQLNENEIKNSTCFNLSLSQLMPRYLRIAQLSKEQLNIFQKLLTFGQAGAITDKQTCNKKDGVRTPPFDIHINFHRDCLRLGRKEADPQKNTGFSFLDGLNEKELNAFQNSTLLI